jgi:hypothetical protein
MSLTTLLTALGLLASAAAEPTVSTTISVDQLELTRVTCDLREGAGLAEDAITATLVGRGPALAACVEEPTDLRVQWSWGAEYGATIVVTEAPSETLADRVEGTLEPTTRPEMVGYCVAYLHLEPPDATAEAER